MAPMKALSRIRLQDEDYVFLMCEYDSESKLFLKILNIKRKEAFIGQASDAELRSQAASIRIAFCNYIEKFTKALFESSSDFIYCLDLKDEKYVFRWKSIDIEETIVTLGNVDMNKVDSVYVFSEVLQSLSEELCSLNEKVQTLDKELIDSKTHTTECLKQLSAATKVNESLEREQYSKFILVLNEKKRKIRELQSNTNLNLNSCNNKPQKKQSKRITHLLSSDSSDEVDDPLESHPGPSTSTRKNGLLFLDESKPVVPSTQNRIRNRKVPVSKNCNHSSVLTVSKPICSKEKQSNNDESDESLLAFL